MTTAKQVKIMVLDLARVADPKPSTIQELRNLVCDGCLHGFKDGSKLSLGEMDKMAAYIHATEKALRRAGRLAA